MAQVLTVHVALAEDLSMVPWGHISQLTTTCNPNTMSRMLSSGFHRHPHTLTRIIKILKIGQKAIEVDKPLIPVLGRQAVVRVRLVYPLSSRAPTAIEREPVSHN